MTFTSLHLLIDVYESSPLEEEPLEIIRIRETVRASLSGHLVSFRLKNLPHALWTFFFFMCDYCLRDIQKYLTASLSWWLVSSRLKILTTCKQDFFFFMCDYCLRDIPKKNFLEPRFHVG